jgi:hypothetical protein
MSFAAVENIVQALLYEGYLLYPYRLSALKNRQRWLFGRLLPREFCVAHDEAEAWKMQAECLIRGSLRTELTVSVRFLQLVGQSTALSYAACETVERDVPATIGPSGPMPSETTERTVPMAVNLEQITSCPSRVPFAFPPQLAGAVTLAAAEVEPGLFKLTVVIENLSSGVAGQDLDRALVDSLLSTHTLLRAQEGSFLSLLGPPEPYRALAASCQNHGAWPVLIGPEPGQRMLAAPLILYDYPQVAPESPGDLFDGTEIDELLSLRIQTLTPAEKREMSASSERARAILERTDGLTEDQLLNLHASRT